ncbi:MAG: CoB--CoM heterodisulfide reductase iron-sulfur subunit A family protein [Dehalococcoidales bacterium]|nr:MAG: CoB--CoM heterodisulfide reductase iron-sulfur subunit A family protein [Dehalococcoidales bacterium]
MVDKVGAVLVIGAGVGGLRAALDLAESGFKAYLVDSNPGIGGTVPQLDKWFPDNGCELCKLLPVFSRDGCSQFCLRRDMAHPNIELLPNSQIQEVTGEAGNFEVTINSVSRWVKTERCTGCRLCAEVCPVEVPDEYNDGLQLRKAIYVRSPQAIPNFYCIDRETCTKCGKCIEVCPTNAIDLNLPDESQKVAVGAIIVSSGFQEFDAAEMGQYGFNRYANVLNNLQVERLLASGGRTTGELLRPSDEKVPKKVGFLQCVGSRDTERNYCSTACCMYTLKEAILIKEKYPDTEVIIFYMDMRAFGKGYHRYYQQAQELGVKFVHSRVSVIRENPKTKNLLLLTRAEDGTDIRSEYDLVVLAAAQCPSARATELNQALGVDVNQWGFIQSQDWWQTRTSKEGIYVCGSAAAPADIADSVIQAGAAACEAATLLASARDQLVEAEAESVASAASDEDTKVAVIICQCGEEITAAVNTAQVAEFAQTLPDVTSVEEVRFLCLPETLEEVKKSITKSGANRVIFAACAPYHYHRLLGNTMREAGIDPSLWQLVNIREQLAWVHKDDQAQATEKAKKILAATVDRIRGQEPLRITPMTVEQKALVIGAGVSGMVAALSLAEQGFETYLVEKSAETGGHAGEAYYNLGNEDPQAFINDLRKKVKNSSQIHLYPETGVVEVNGRSGNFSSILKAADDTTTEIIHGAIIVATGAEDYVPTEYQYGQNDKIITQKELQQLLVKNGLGKPTTVVMIQCVGSRDEGHPYCNRTCCSDAIVNALNIKEQSPETEVYVLNRDIITYAFREEYYSKARETGVLFIRFNQEDPPEVNATDKAITIRVNDPVLPGKLEIDADLLVLSTGIVTGDNRALAETLSIELNEDGFFREVDTKFRPVDTAIDGIFICGRANAPRNLDEEIAQAQAAAQRAVNILSRKELQSGRIVSEVNARRCSYCGICVTTCPFNARWLDEDEHVAVVDEALCQACGACVAACPNSAAKLRGYRDKQILSVIEAVL